MSQPVVHMVVVTGAAGGTAPQLPKWWSECGVYTDRWVEDPDSVTCARCLKCMAAEVDKLLATGVKQWRGEFTP